MRLRADTMGQLRMLRARDAYCRVASVSAALPSAMLTQATMTVTLLPPSESCSKIWDMERVQGKRIGFILNFRVRVRVSQPHCPERTCLTASEHQRVSQPGRLPLSDASIKLVTVTRITPFACCTEAKRCACVDSFTMRGT